MKFSELQDQLKKNFDIEFLADIARELGVTPQAVSNWKARNRVPYKYVVKIRNKIEKISLESARTRTDENYKQNVGKPPNQFESNKFFEKDAVSITEILMLFFRHLKIIVFIPTIFCTITIFHALYNTTPQFKSYAKIMSSTKTGSSKAGGLAAQFGFTLPGDNSEPRWVYPEIIKSRTLAKAMLKRKFNTIKYGSDKSLLQILTYGDQRPSIDLDILIKHGTKNVIDMVDLQSQGTYYILTVTASEPLLARDLVTAFIDELDLHQKRYNKTRTAETRRFIEDRISATEVELQAAEEHLKNFRDRNRRIQNSPALQLEQERLSREVSVLIGVFTTLKQQLETVKIKEVDYADNVIVLDPPEAPLKPSGPKKKQMVIMSGIVGITFGFLLALLIEYLNNTNHIIKHSVTETTSSLLSVIKKLALFRK